MERLLAWEQDRGRAEALVDGDHPFVLGGSLLPLAMVELMAQAVASHEGYRAFADGRAPALGFLGGVRGFRWRRSPRVGERLVIECERETTVDEFHVIRGRVLGGDGVCASARLLLFLGELPGAGNRPTPAAGHGGQRSVAEALLALARDGPDAATVTFPPSFPAFEGHFPGRPVLPAVVLLVLGERMLATREGGAGGRIGVHRAKFTRPVFPGDTVRIVWQEARSRAGRRVMMACTAGEELVARVTYDQELGS